MVAGLPANSDVYFVAQRQGESELYKLRAQALPLRLGPASFGVTAQHVQGSFPTRDEAGLVGRLQGKLGTGVTAKGDLRYWPGRGELDTYIIMNTPHMFADLLGSYMPASRSGWVVIGVDYKLGKHVMIGVEMKAKTTVEDVCKEVYAGPRVKATF
jgi:hypothetical protein